MFLRIKKQLLKQNDEYCFDKILDFNLNIFLPEEQPSRDETFISFTWWLLHNVQIWWIETQGSGWQTVSNL